LGDLRAPRAGRSPAYTHTEQSRVYRLWLMSPRRVPRPSQVKSRAMIATPTSRERMREYSPRPVCRACGNPRRLGAEGRPGGPACRPARKERRNTAGSCPPGSASRVAARAGVPLKVAPGGLVLSAESTARARPSGPLQRMPLARTGAARRAPVSRSGLWTRQRRRGDQHDRRILQDRATRRRTGDGGQRPQRPGHGAVHGAWRRPH
jgi:hypothetical protein